MRSKPNDIWWVEYWNGKRWCRWDGGGPQEDAAWRWERALRKFDDGTPLRLVRYVGQVEYARTAGGKPGKQVRER